MSFLGSIRHLQKAKGMKIVAVTRVQPPFTYPCVLDNTCDTTKEGGGINYDIFYILMSILGIDFDLIDADQSTTGYQDDDGNWHGMMGQIYNGEANMTATLVSFKTERLSVVDYCTPVSYYISGFIVKRPTSQDLRAIPTFLTTPFTAGEWIAVMVSFLLALLVFTAARRVLDSVPVFSAFREQSFLSTRALLQQTHYNTNRHAIRLMASTMEIALFFLTAQYSSVLTSSLLVRPKPPTSFDGFDKFAQLVYDGKLTLISDSAPESSKYIPITDKLDSDDPDIKLRIAYKWNPPIFVPTNDYAAIVKAVSKNASIVYFNSYYQLLNVAAMSCEVMVIEDTFTHPTWLSFAFPKGSPLQNLISTTLHHDATSAAGFVNRLYKKYAKNRQCQDVIQESSYEPMGMIHMQGAFWIVIMGAIFAWLSLICEKMYCMCKSKECGFNKFEILRKRIAPSGKPQKMIVVSNDSVTDRGSVLTAGPMNITSASSRKRESSLPPLRNRLH